MVTASIVTYHTPLSELDTCLRSLATPLVDKIFIVDNARESGVRDWCERKSNVEYIPSDNRGYGAGHNQAIRKILAGDGYHLVMNADVEFDPSVIDKIAAFMDANPRVGTLQPRMVDGQGNKQYSCRALPTPFDVFVRRFCPKSWFIQRRDAYLLKHLDETKTWNIPYHQGSFMFMRLSALRDVGLFDERFFMYPEDIDLTRRLHCKYLTLYWPDVAVMHRHEAASYKSLKMMWIHVVNMCRYFNKWGWVRDSDRKRFNDRLSCR